MHSHTHAMGAAVGYGVAAYYDGDYGDEAFGVGDCGVVGHETE